MWYKSIPEIIIPPLERIRSAPGSRLNIQNPISVPALVPYSTIVQLAASLNFVVSVVYAASDITFKSGCHPSCLLYSKTQNFKIVQCETGDTEVTTTFEILASQNIPTIGYSMIIAALQSNGGGYGGSGIAIAYLALGYGMCILIDRKKRVVRVGWMMSDWEWKTVNIS